MKRRHGRVFLDTVYVLALYNRGDQHHKAALAYAPRLDKVSEIWTTEAVLLEIGNGLSAVNRPAAVEFIKSCYAERGPIRLVRLTSELLREALQLYASRQDKRWGLTDCISFVVMNEIGLTDALTTDHHFEQAGFRALLLEAP